MLFAETESWWRTAANGNDGRRTDGCQQGENLHIWKADREKNKRKFWGKLISETLCGTKDRFFPQLFCRKNSSRICWRALKEWLHNLLWQTETSSVTSSAAARAFFFSQIQNVTSTSTPTQRSAPSCNSWRVNIDLVTIMMLPVWVSTPSLCLRTSLRSLTQSHGCWGHNPQSPLSSSTRWAPYIRAGEGHTKHFFTFPLTENQLKVIWLEFVPCCTVTRSLA